MNLRINSQLATSVCSGLLVAATVAVLAGCDRSTTLADRTTPPPANSAPPSTTPSAPVTQAPSRSAGQTVDDAAVTAKVKAALVGDSQVKATDVNVDTDRGVVRLSGMVETQAEADRAVELARGVSGVVSVANNLRVRSS